MAAVPSGIPEPIVVSFEIVRVLKARDREALARLTHSSARAAVAARPLDASDFWVQAAASESSSQARSDGTRWLVRFAELAPEEVAVLVLARDGGLLRLLDVQRMSRAAYEAFGSLAS